jgi:hypothetical protein
VQNSWYLYAIQAGNEPRTGGLPYNNSFSVSLNGVTPAAIDDGGTETEGSALRVQLTDLNSNFHCYTGRWTSGLAIPITQFNIRC